MDRGAIRERRSNTVTRGCQKARPCVVQEILVLLGAPLRTGAVRHRWGKAGYAGFLLANLYFRALIVERDEAARS